jgi:hypothetical protein
MFFGSGDALVVACTALQCQVHLQLMSGPEYVHNLVTRYSPRSPT